MAIEARERQGLRPTAGARLLLDLLATDGATARYAAWVLTPDREHGFDATLDDTGAATVTAHAVTEPTDAAGAPDAGAAAAATADDDPLPDVQMLARLVARGAARRAADGLAPWPPRVLRWRGPGRGA